jgi:hypothetical protein
MFLFLALKNAKSLEPVSILLLGTERGAVMVSNFKIPGMLTIRYNEYNDIQKRVISA